MLAAALPADAGPPNTREAEVTFVPIPSRATVAVPAQPRGVLLYSRAHIDLQRVAASLCRS